MGRELKRKEQRKNKNIKAVKRAEELDNSVKLSTLFKIGVFCIVILLVLYYLVAVFITKEIDISWSSDNETTDVESNNVSNRILAKNIFNQSEETYYVYFYNFSEADSGIESAISGKDLTIYRVDAGSALNQNYVTEENGNRNVTSISDLMVKSPTIIKIDADKVTAYYEGRNAILDFLS